MTCWTYPLNHLAWFVLRVRKSLFATSRPLTPGRIPRSSRTMDLLPVQEIGRSMWHPAGGRDCGQQTDSGRAFDHWARQPRRDAAGLPARRQAAEVDHRPGARPRSGSSRLLLAAPAEALPGAGAGAAQLAEPCCATDQHAVDRAISHA